MSLDNERAEMVGSMFAISLKCFPKNWGTHWISLDNAEGWLIGGMDN